MITLREFTFPSSDGVHAVHAQEWLPDTPPRAVVQLVHGLSEYIARYDHFARFLCKQGFAVCGHDHLGHGGTAVPEEYGYFADQNGWDLITRDVRALRELERERFPGLPYFLLGHSMGSFAVRTYLIRWPGTLTGALLSGTGQEPPLSVGAGKALASLCAALRGPRAHSRLLTALSLGGYNKQFRPNRTPNDWINRDDAMVDLYTADPLCQFTPTVSMFRDMMGGLQFIADPENLARMDPDTPVLFFSGGNDPVGGNGAGVEKVAGFFRQAGCRDLTVKLYPGARHEILNELNRDEVYHDILAWLDDRLSRPGQV